MMDTAQKFHGSAKSVFQIFALLEARHFNCCNFDCSSSLWVTALAGCAVLNIESAKANQSYIIPFL